jgi:hypothetical protein
MGANDKGLVARIRGGHSTEIAKPEGASVSLAAAPMISDAEIDRMFRIAKAFAMSGVFKDVAQAEQAFAKIMVGRDLGLSPSQAMMGIDFVEGAPQVRAVMLASFVQKHPGGYDYEILKHDDSAIEIRFTKNGKELGVSKYDMAKAAKAGLTGKHNWKKHPENMLFARAMSNGVKWHCPEVTGGVPVYYEGEIIESTASEVSAPEPDAPPEVPAIEASIPEAEVAPEAPDEVSAEDRTALVDAFAAAGFDDMSTFLTAVGAEDLDTITEQQALDLRGQLASAIEREAAAA